MRDLCDISAITKAQTVLCIAIVTAAVAVSAYYLNISVAPVPFSLIITNRPASFGDVVYSIPTQKCIFLVVVEDERRTNGAEKSVSLSVKSSDCEVAVFPQTITSGQIAELTITPTEANIGNNVTVTLEGERNGLKRTKTITIEVIEGEDTLEPEATHMREMFIPWLSTNHLELSITSETAWTGTIVNPRILVVMHYVFLSEEWEMYVTWHVMIPPYD